MKAIGYVRVSTEGQAQDGVSVDAQEAKLRAWAELNGAAEVAIYRDEGLSGKRADNRPGLRAALEAVGKGDALIVYSLSRLSRSTRDTLALADALAAREADLVSMAERIDTTTAAGKMVFRMLAVLAEFERDQIADRTRFALAHKRARGEKTGGDVPYGWQAAGGGQLVREPSEQDGVALMRRLRQSGASLRGIARELESRGFRAKSGGERWHPQIVRQILARECSRGRTGW